jgi:predicted O-methyltransferase YrrM
MINSRHTNVPGWESPAEQQLLYTLAQGVPDYGCIVELGAEYGLSASLFCWGAKASVQIVSIDLFPGDLLAQHQENLRRAGLGGRSMQMIGNSHTIGARWQGHEPFIDLLFVDGDHSYQGVVADIALWTPLVRAGGVVAFHDCACETNPLPMPIVHEEVWRAVQEWHAVHPAWTQIGMVDSLVAYMRLLFYDTR